MQTIGTKASYGHRPDFDAIAVRITDAARPNTYTFTVTWKQLELINIAIRAGIGDDGIEHIGLTKREQRLPGQDRQLSLGSLSEALSNTLAASAREYFAFQPAEVAKLLKFLSDIKRIHFPNEGTINISDADLEELLLSPAQIKQLATNNLELLAALARTEITSEDIVALGYRRIADRALLLRRVPAQASQRSSLQAHSEASLAKLTYPFPSPYIHTRHNL